MSMQLRDLGFDDWFAENGRAVCEPGQHYARVTAVDRGQYLVRNEERETRAELTGKFLYETADSTELPCVGDWVCVRYHDDGAFATLHHLLPRRSFLRRKAPGRDISFQMLAANIDVAFVVQSCEFDFNVRRLERYLVMVREGQIEPLVLLTKTDLVSPEQLELMIGQLRRAGITAEIVTLSNVTGDGIDAIRRLIVTGKTYCLLGSSGVGKTTLINRLTGRNELETQAVSGTGEGRHTTTRRQLFVLSNGGLLIDMPGMRELGLMGAGEGLDDSFAEIRELAQACRFADCTHAGEPGCAVRTAVESGELDERHLESYLKLKKETEFHDLSYAEKRKKDKAFGRYIHTARKRGDFEDK